jgi:hypothetical protein
MGYSNGVRTSLQLLGAHSEKIVRGARKENGRRLHLRACIACVCASPHGEPCWRHVATPVRRRLPTWRPAGRDGGSRCALRGQSETAPLVLSAALLGWLRAGQWRTPCRDALLALLFSMGGVCTCRMDGGWPRLLFLFFVCFFCLFGIPMAYLGIWKKNVVPLLRWQIGTGPVI